MSSVETGRSVHDFYQTLHFNEGTDAAADLAVIQSGRIAEAQLLPSFLSDLDKININKGMVVEAGCGIGWLSISVQKMFPDITLHALDFSERALQRAKELSGVAGSNVAFHQQNLLDKKALTVFEGAHAVFSIGVLHHTGDFLHAFRNCLGLLQPGGSAYVGLYHLYRRAPFLRHFQELTDQSVPVAELRKEYARLDGRTLDKVRQESWFQDQVLHPHETQHTIQEVLDIAGEGFEHVSNSITGQQLPGRDKLLVIEQRQEMLGKHNLENAMYDPGFFMVHIRKRTL